jgi:hypothetical protein
MHKLGENFSTLYSNDEFFLKTFFWAQHVLKNFDKENKRLKFQCHLWLILWSFYWVVNVLEAFCMCVITRIYFKLDFIYIPIPFKRQVATRIEDFFVTWLSLVLYIVIFHFQHNFIGGIISFDNSSFYFTLLFIFI